MRHGTAQDHGVEKTWWVMVVDKLSAARQQAFIFHTLNGCAEQRLVERLACVHLSLESVW